MKENNNLFAAKEDDRIYLFINASTLIDLATIGIEHLQNSKIGDSRTVKVLTINNAEGLNLYISILD